MDIATLPWLPPAPADFAERCADARGGADIAWLAAHALDSRKARRLGKALSGLRVARADLAPLANFRLVALCNATFDFIADHLPAAAARHGVALDLVLPPYDQAMQQALDPSSETCAAGADGVLLALDHRWLGLEQPALEDAAGALAAAAERLIALIEALAQNTRAQPILCTLPSPPEPLFGSLDARVAGSRRALIAAMNARILELAGARGALVLDVAALAEQVGTQRWFDPVQHLAYKLPFASALGGLYADWLARLLGAARGKARKCLVLDLDNTLWGGVVGDDGVESLVLGEGSARGEAFLAIQRMARELKARGVILAVSSKNDDAVARAAFGGHPEMVLALSDMAVFQANWRDKASNLEAIAATLNIGPDALVLLDDNPAERAQARAALPTVAVPELPDDPAWFPRMLSAAGYFEAATFSADDRLRAASYAGDARRAEVMATVRDLGDYLTALEMRLTATAFDAAGRGRIAQLINKTNQFNLTTRRYTEAQVAVIEAAPETITLQVRLADRFGDLGMIGVVIARVTDGVADVDSWLMSCRVLGRKVEEAMLARLAEAARAAGAGVITAHYRPTAKNGMVRDLFDRLGFTLTREDPDGARDYALDLANWTAPDLPHRTE
ncbi:MAG: HAD-IIIC family phosphatase [Caulobacteraceae bacterium]